MAGVADGNRHNVYCCCLLPASLRALCANCTAAVFFLRPDRPVSITFGITADDGGVSRTTAVWKAIPPSKEALMLRSTHRKRYFDLRAGFQRADRKLAAISVKGCVKTSAKYDPPHSRDTRNGSTLAVTPAAMIAAINPARTQ